MTMHAMAGGAGRFIAVKLADGRSDKTLYDTRSAAVSHQLSPEYCCFLQVHPGGMTTAEADRVLDYWRQMHDGGFRSNDPRDDIPTMPLTAGDARRQIRLLTAKR
jgi:hypothetical protein